MEYVKIYKNNVIKSTQYTKKITKMANNLKYKHIECKNNKINAFYIEQII